MRRKKASSSKNANKKFGLLYPVDSFTTVLFHISFLSIFGVKIKKDNEQRDIFMKKIAIIAAVTAIIIAGFLVAENSYSKEKYRLTEKRQKTH